MKIKEKILKLGKRKNCFIALLLCILLAFTIISGLNGSKSGKIEANAQTAPQTKNLDLNGIRYTYQTSLNELRNNYNLLYDYDLYWFGIVNDTESRTSIKYSSYSSEPTQENSSNFIETTKDAFKFYFDDKLLDLNVTFDESVPSFDLENINTFENLTALSIDFFKLNRITNTSDFNGVNLQLIYNKSSISTDDYNNNLQLLFENNLYLCYSVSNVNTSLYIDIPRYNGYTLQNIICSCDEKSISENSIYMTTLTNIRTQESLSSDDSFHCAIDNLQFINNEFANIVRYNVNFTEISNAFKGNILLSTEKYDNAYISAMRSLGVNRDVVTFNSSVYFGGNFENNKPQGSIIYQHTNLIAYGSAGVKVTSQNGDTLFTYPDMPSVINIFSPVVYSGQNQLLYLPEFETLRTTYNNQVYAALSAQVEDILYNVNYVGNIEEIEFNEKVEEDFQNLLKLTGLGAFIGLVLGLIFGNPALGAAIGAMWGALIALFPLLIDGLQALFGYNFLSGLYNFFKSITNFFANFVDTIINFFISIITNPFVLILIVIVAIIFVITYFQKK